MGQIATKVANKFKWKSGSSSDIDHPGCSNGFDSRVTPYVRCRTSSMYVDEDGDVAHEFYEQQQQILSANRASLGQSKAGGSTTSCLQSQRVVMVRRSNEELTPVGIIPLDHPRLHVDLPIILSEVRRTSAERH